MRLHVLRRAPWGFAVKSSGFHLMTNAKHARRLQIDDGQNVKPPGRWLEERESTVYLMKRRTHSHRVRIFRNLKEFLEQVFNWQQP